jgi:hypothetical protein
MPRLTIVVLMLSFIAAETLAQSGEQVDRTYKLLRENEDWSALQNPLLSQDLWDPFKFIRLRGVRNDWYVTIGGEVRQDWERIGNDNWGQQPIMNGYLLQRYMLHVDTHYGRYFRTFIQLKSGIETFRRVHGVRQRGGGRFVEVPCRTAGAKLRFGTPGLRP